MINKGKYWIFEKNKGTPVSYFGDLKGTHKGFQYSISPFFDIIQLKVAESLQTVLIEYGKVLSLGYLSTEKLVIRVDLKSHSSLTQ